MVNENLSEYSKAIIERIRLIMEVTDLDIPGFAEFIGKSVPHIYGILNGSRELSESLAREIGKKLEFEGSKIFNLNSSIPLAIQKSKSLINFKVNHRDNFEYFIGTKSKRSIHTFITEVLIPSSCFDDGYKYLKEIEVFCKDQLNREFIDDKLSKGLQYAVKTKILKSTKKPIKLKNGKFGSRMVDVYYKNS